MVSLCPTGAETTDRLSPEESINTMAARLAERDLADYPLAIEWLHDFVKAAWWLQVFLAAWRLAISISVFGFLNIYFSMNRLSIETEAYQSISVCLLVAGLVTLPLLASLKYYFRLRKAHASREIYLAGYRMTGDGQLATNEPNPKVVVGVRNEGRS